MPLPYSSCWMNDYATHRNGCSGPYCGFTGHRHHSCSSDCSEAYRNFCGAYNRGPALWEQACRPVIFVAWKMMRPRWWAGWRENAIQQSEEMPRVRACDEEERADRQGRPAVEMPGLPVELDDAAAAAQAGADAGGVPFLAAGAVIPKGGGLRGRRPRPAQTNRMVLAHPPAHRPAGRQAPHGHGGRHVHGPRLVPCFASMFVRQVRQCFSVVWADGFPRCRHRFPVM